MKTGAVQSVGPQGLKPPRNNKNEGFTMAHLKVRPFKASATQFFRSL